MFPSGRKKLSECQNEKNPCPAARVKNSRILLVGDTLKCIVYQVARNILRCIIRTRLFSLLRIPNLTEIFINLTEDADGYVSKIKIFPIDRSLKCKSYMLPTFQDSPQIEK